jgi:hypothetical protein
MISSHESASENKCNDHDMAIKISRQNYVQMIRLLKHEPLLRKISYLSVN